MSPFAALTQLDYYNARYYDPFVGVFLSADTKQGNLQGVSPYAYVGGNPETQSDPSGLRPSPECPTNSCNAPLTGDDLHMLCNAITRCEQNLANYHEAIFLQHLKDDVLWGVTIGEGFGAIADAIITGNPSALEEEQLQLEQDAEMSAEREVLQNDIANGGCSFTSETQVKTEHGEQVLGNVHAGEKVLAYNPRTRKMEFQPILHVWIHQDDDLVDLTITLPTQSPHSKGSQTPRQTSEVVHTNKKHPFLTIEKGFLPVGQIKVGMHVLRADGRIGLITNWKLIPGVATMYNLEVANDHTFTVGTGEWIVHNCTPIGEGQYDQQMITDFLGTNSSKSAEAQVGLLARSQNVDVNGYNVNIEGGPTGRIGQIDVETPNTIFEVKNGKNWQGTKYNDQIAGLQGPEMNPTGKRVVIYAPNLKTSQIPYAEATGAIVITNEEELITYLNLFG